VRCTYDPATRGGDAPDVRKVKATLHWVAAEHAQDAEVRLYDHLFSKPDPDEMDADKPDANWLANLNPASLEVLSGCKIEPTWREARGPDWPDGIARVQFERHGYFCVDRDSSSAKPVFNRTVTLRDSWAKIEKSQSPGKR